MLRAEDKVVKVIAGFDKGVKTGKKPVKRGKDKDN